MTNSRDAGGRRRVEKQVVRNGKVVKANVWGVERSEAASTLGQALHDSGFINYGEQMSDSSDSAQSNIEHEVSRRAESTQEARDRLDYWEHYANHPEFIKEVGGRDAYDAELSRRFDVFLTLNTKSTAVEVSSALAELESIKLENS